jgi:ABC-type polysaccharide/polyol phosphate export permease
MKRAGSGVARRFPLESEPSDAAREVDGGQPEEERPSEKALALLDLGEAIQQAWFWMALGWHDIVRRYRGSILGPFWLTLTTAAFIAGLGPLYAGLFGLDVKQFLPFMALGVLVWNFITATINDCCSAFIDRGQVMKQTRLPRLTCIFHVMWRNILMFAHSLPVYVAVVLYCQIPLTWQMLLVVPGLFLLVFNLLWIGLLLAIACLRFRDVQQIVSSLLLLAFFFTPVMWSPKLQSVNPWVVNANPFAALIELVRAPLLGEAISLPLLVLALACLVIGTATAALAFIKYRKQIIYWV